MANFGSTFFFVDECGHNNSRAILDSRACATEKPKALGSRMQQSHLDIFSFSVGLYLRMCARFLFSDHKSGFCRQGYGLYTVEVSAGKLKE